MQPTPTVSPTLKLLTPLPTLVTRPTISWPGQTGKTAVVPLIAGGVQVGMADAAELNVDLDVVHADIAAVEGEGGERCGRGL